MPARIDLPDDVIERVLALRKQGVGIETIAAEVNYSRCVVERYCDGDRYNVIKFLDLDVESRRVNVEAMREFGVPETHEHRSACRGHSRQWINLYALRLLNPGYKHYGESENAIV